MLGFQVLKYLSTEQEPHKGNGSKLLMLGINIIFFVLGVEFLTDCQHCDRPVRGAHCSYCKLLSLRYVVEQILHPLKLIIENWT